MIQGYIYGSLHARGARARAYAVGVLALYLFLLAVYPPVLAWLIFTPWRESASPDACLVLMGTLMALIATVLACSVIYGRGRRAYMPATRDAVLIVRATERGWRVENFFAARPKGSNTAPLWGITVPALVEAADARGVKIMATVMNESLEGYYQRKIPGLRRLGVLCTGQVKLLRVPRPRPTS